jgi:hypothetical protein
MISADDRARDSALRRTISAPCPDSVWEWSDSIHYNDIDLCRKMLDAGGDANALTSAGFPALIESIREQKTELASLLIERGADPNCYDRFKWSALSYAVRSSNVDICRKLVRAGAIPSYVPPGAVSGTVSPFMESVSGRGAAFRFFIEECGEDPAQRTAGGATLMRIASPPVKEYLRALKSSQKLSDAVVVTGESTGPSSTKAAPGLL